MVAIDCNSYQRMFPVLYEKMPDPNDSQYFPFLGHVIDQDLLFCTGFDKEYFDNYNTYSYSDTIHINE